MKRKWPESMEWPISPNTPFHELIHPRKNPAQKHDRRARLAAQREQNQARRNCAQPKNAVEAKPVMDQIVRHSRGPFDRRAQPRIVYPCGYRNVQPQRDCKNQEPHTHAEKSIPRPAPGTTAEGICRTCATKVIGSSKPTQGTSSQEGYAAENAPPRKNNAHGAAMDLPATTPFLPISCAPKTHDENKISGPLKPRPSRAK